MRSRLVWLSVWLCIGIPVFGQWASSRYLNTVHGLPVNTVYTSMMDSKGTLWFGTEKGVSRYDGFSFTNFTTSDGLSDNEVFSIFEDSKSRIWFLTYNGVLSYYHQGSFHNPENTPLLRQPNIHSLLATVVEDHEGTLYFHSRKDGILRLKADSFDILGEDTANVHIMVGDSMVHMVSSNADQATILDVSTPNYQTELVIYNRLIQTDVNTFHDGKHFFMSRVEGGVVELSIWDAKRKSFTSQPLPGLETGRPICMSFVDDRLLIGTHSGLYIYDKERFEFQSVLFENHAITSILKDFEGNYWFTTLKQGILYSSPSIIKRYAETDDYIGCLSRNRKTGELWAGGVDQYHRIYQGKKESFHIEGGWNETISTILPTARGKALIGSGVFLVNHYQKPRMVHFEMYGLKSLHYDTINQKLLMGLATRVLQTSLSEVNKPRITSYEQVAPMRGIFVFPLNADQVLIASNRGLYRYNRKTKENTRLLTHRVDDIARDALGRIWVSSKNKGLFLLEGDTVHRFSDNDVLLSTNINGITIDDQGSLWLASDHAVIKAVYEKSNLQTERFEFNATEKQNIINDIEVIGDTVIVATNRGLYFFNHTTYARNVQKPRLVVSSIAINGEISAIQPQYTLKPSDKIVQLEYAGISYSASEIRYRYRFSQREGKGDWLYTESRLLDIPHLSPGKHFLTLQAIKNQRILSDPVHLEFYMTPPFYTRPRFYVLLLILAAAILSLIAWIKVRQVRRQAHVSEVISYSQQKALRAQMNPHFLFNSMNSIQQFFINNNNDAGQEYISKFSNLLRNILEHSEKDEISIAEEVESLTTYMALEKLRMERPFDHCFDIDESIDQFNTHIPTMLIQPLIENAIWHGINYLTKRIGFIHISIAEGPDKELVIRVDDNGIGLERSREIGKNRKHKSKGTDLLKNRIYAINLTRDKDVVFSLKERDTGGTTAQFIIP